MLFHVSVRYTLASIQRAFRSWSWSYGLDCFFLYLSTYSIFTKMHYNSNINM